MVSATYTVSGMTCEQCVSSVREEIGEVETVTSVKVDLPSGAVTVLSEGPVGTETVRAAVEEAGYELSGGPA